MAEKDTNAKRKTRPVRVSTRTRDGLARLAARRGMTMGALVERMYLDEVSRERKERARVKEWKEAGL